MSIISPTTIAEHIIAKLWQGPRSTSELLAVLQSELSITKQAFYAALRQLLREEAVVKYRDYVALDTTWISRLQEMIAIMEHHYTVGKKSALFDFLKLNDGESLSYKFSSVAHLDQFWGNLQNLVMANTDQNDHIYVYDPHYWFYVARQKTEHQLLKNIATKKRYFLMSVGGNTPLDKYIKDRAQTKYVRLNTGEKLFPNTSLYVTVIGGYVWHVTLDASVARAVEKLFTEYTTPNSLLIEELSALLVQPSKNKLKVERNHKKATLLRKKMGKEFTV